MLQIRSTHRLDQIEMSLRNAAERCGGSVLAVSHVGHLVADRAANDAITFTVCFSELYAPLLEADIRFAAFLPVRVAAVARGEGVMLEAISPREGCRILHRPELEPLAVPLEERLRAVMEEAAHIQSRAAAAAEGHLATEDQVNMRAALPQRIDCHGTKVEELAGTGVHDAQGG